MIGNSLQAGAIFTATLTWFRDRETIGTTAFLDASFDNLDLELWSEIGGVAQDLISASNSRYNNTEHFQFAIPTSGDYMIRVRWVEELFDTVGDANFDQYGLAWSTATTNVPEPIVAHLDDDCHLIWLERTASPRSVVALAAMLNAAILVAALAIGKVRTTRILNHLLRFLNGCVCTSLARELPFNGQFLNRARALCQHRTAVRRSP